MISVIIVTYNRKKLLEKSLDSVFSQDYKGSYEVSVIDNYSTDGAKESVAKKYNGKVKLIENKTSRSLSNCKSQGFTISSGDIIAFTDDDCVVAKDWLSSIENSLLKYDFVGGAVLPISEVMFPWWWRDSLDWLIGLNQNPTHKYLPTGSNVAFKRHVLESIEFHEGNVLMKQNECLQYGEDNCRLKKALGKGFRMGINKNMIVYHHIPPERLKISYLFKRSFAEGRIWADRESTFKIFLLRVMAFASNPFRFLVTWDINRIFRISVSLGYILTYFKKSCNCTHENIDM